ncbi:MAG TPA: hypothetical protein VFD33_05425 [Bacillota bacterium]|nr:hypothetical protein [Bacillota bacterium]
MKSGRQCVLDGIKIAMAYVGTVIGAGFATGQEILQFFTKYGYNAVYAIGVTTLLFIVVGRKILVLSRRLDAPSFGLLIDHVFGPVSPLVNIYLAISYILICGAMFAGAGALSNELFGTPYILGAFFIATCTLIVSLLGVKGILATNSVIVPFITIFTLVLLLNVLTTNNKTLVSGGISAGQVFPLLKTAITYASFNLILSIGVLAPLGGAVKDIKSLYIGSVLGGGILGLLMLASHTSMLYYVPDVFNKEIPIMLIVDGLGKPFMIFYGVIIWMEIFSTAIGNLFSIDTLVREKSKTQSNIPAVVICAAALFICLFGFSNIVQWFYPALGVLGFVLVGMIFIYA